MTVNQGPKTSCCLNGAYRIQTLTGLDPIGPVVPFLNFSVSRLSHRAPKWKPGNFKALKSDSFQQIRSDLNCHNLASDAFKCEWMCFKTKTKKKMSAVAFHQIYFHAVRYGWTLFEKKVRSKKTRLSLPTIESSLSIISHYEDTHLWPTWLLIDQQHCERHNERKDQDWFIFTFSLILIKLRYFLQKTQLGLFRAMLNW